MVMFTLLTTIGFGVSALYGNDELVRIPENHLAGMDLPTKCIVADLETEVVPIKKQEVTIIPLEELIIKAGEEWMDKIIEELIANMHPIEKPEVVIVPIEEFEEVTTEETTTKVATTAKEATTKVVTTKPTTTKETTKVSTTKQEKTSWNGKKLNKIIGTVNGPSGKETYYNLEMSGVIRIMRNLGYSEEKYPYSVRKDGVKMLGPYIMCAANLSLRPRGTILETSLGTAIVCDTGGFAKKNPRQLDIAVNW